MIQSPFRVIIVGGGPIGLAAAHALSKADIDFLLLEARPSILEDSGASLVVFQGTLRILSQLNLLDRLHEVSVDFCTAHLKAILDDYKYGTVSLEGAKDDFGAYARIARRSRVLQVLYDGLSDRDKARVLTGSKASAVISDETGVEVRCANGTTHKGSMVIGADGAHSCSREAIRSLALKSQEPEPETEADTESETEAEKQKNPSPFVSSYRALWFSAPKPASVVSGTGCSSHGDNMSSQVLYDADTAYTFLYERLEKPTSDKVSYSEEDMQLLIDRWGDLQMDENIPIKQLFDRRYRSGMTNLQEGLVDEWSGGRVVLAGDSAHIMVPNAALGFNSGIQDVTVLANELWKTLKQDARPGVDALSDAFRRYHDSRLGELKKDALASRMAIRYQTRETIVFRILDRYIMPFIPALQDFLLNFGMTERLRRQRVLLFVPGHEPFRGKIPWEYPIEQAAA